MLARVMWSAVMPRAAGGTSAWPVMYGAVRVMMKSVVVVLVMQRQPVHRPRQVLLLGRVVVLSLLAYDRKNRK